MAIVYARKYNAVVTIRTDVPGNDSFEVVRKQLISKSSMIHKSLDASYVVFKLIDAAVKNISPLIEMYENALEALEFIFDMYKPTTKRKKCPRRFR
jgi:Mg2+ and Co2+ transporter CorA